MATIKNESVEKVEKTENTTPEATTDVEAIAVVTEDGLFTKIGKKIDGGFTKVKDFGKRNGKKIAKGAGVAAGAAVAVVGTALVVDTMSKAKALTGETDPVEEPIDVEPFEAEDPAEVEYLEAEAEVAA